MAKVNYVHDWIVRGTLECILAYLQARNLDCEGIHFQGEGWYSGDGDTLLIVRDKEQWCLLGWDKFDPRPIFQQLLAMENCDA